MSTDNTVKTRMRFTKTGSLKFIGHLDCMRFFQKALRRAGLDMAYSKGYNPHQIMSFAAPLSVGVTSDGEYIDVAFQSLSNENEKEWLAHLNQYMTEEIFVTELHVLEDTAKTSMSLLEACDYLITLKDGGCFYQNTESQEEFVLRDAFCKFMEQEEIRIVKKTKRSQKEMDIRPFIQAWGFSKEEFQQNEGTDVIPELHNEYDSKEELWLRLTSGSVTNIKPELVLEAFMNQLGTALLPYSWQVHRVQMYFRGESAHEE